MSELLGASALVVACISTTGATYMREVLKLLEERMPKEEVIHPASTIFAVAEANSTLSCATAHPSRFPL